MRRLDLPLRGVNLEYGILDLYDDAIPTKLLKFQEFRIISLHDVGANIRRIQRTRFK